METEQNIDKKAPKRRRNSLPIILFNLFAMLVVSALLIWLTLGGLKIYTRHNQAFPMPDIYGMSQEDALRVLKKGELKMEISDSVYNEAMPPGVILETIPKAGSMIKKKRTIFVVVNNTQVKHLIIPNIFEISRRQAEALLSGSGFTNVTIKYIPGTFHDLSLYLKNTQGRILQAGERVPYNEPLTLEVSNADLMEEYLRDSLENAALNDSIAPTLDDPNTVEEPESIEEDWFWHPKSWCQILESIMTQH